MYHVEFVDFRSTLAVLLPLSYVTKMITDVKAALANVVVGARLS